MFPISYINNTLSKIQGLILFFSFFLLFWGYWGNIVEKIVKLIVSYVKIFMLCGYL